MFGVSRAARWAARRVSEVLGLSELTDFTVIMGGRKGWAPEHAVADSQGNTPIWVAVTRYSRMNSLEDVTVITAPPAHTRAAVAARTARLIHPRRNVEGCRP